MVTPNVEGLSQSFDTIIQERDVASAGVLGLAGATGGVIATQIAGRVAPLLGLPQQPTGLAGLLANGTIKMLVGAGLGFAAIRLGGTPGAILAVAALGSLVLGGGDWINGILSQSAGVPGAQTARQALSQGNRGAGPARSAQPVQTEEDPDQVGFRQGQGGGAQTATASASSFR